MHKTHRVWRREHLWSIILAGGDGGRVTPLIQRWLGRNKPKQYCTFVGTRSMLQHTLDRASRVTQLGHHVTVIKREHEEEARHQLKGKQYGSLIIQPANRDTAAGIFLPLTYVRARDPEATVLIYPSDHFIYPEDQFVGVMLGAARAAERFSNSIVLLGVIPDRIDSDYGWIWPGQNLGSLAGLPVRVVRRFQEKSDPLEARTAYAGGALWNTMIMASTIDALWSLGHRAFPDIMPLFESLEKAIGTPQEIAEIESIYRMMPSHGFASELLACATDQLAVVEFNDVVWSDWSKPERIAESLRRIGKQPAFPLEYLVEPDTAERVATASKGSRAGA